MTEKLATRDGFGQGLVEAAREDERVVAVVADLEESLRLLDFKREFPKRLVEVGVAEQNMMGVAAGMASMGKKPFACSFAVFSPGRNWDQIRVSVAYSQQNVIIVGGHAGLTVGEDGATHQAMEDMAMMRVLPNMMVVVPADAEEARKAVKALAKIDGCAYLRLSRWTTPVFTKGNEFVLGKANILRSGDEITVIACGDLVHEALLAVDDLRGRISCELINMHTIKPLDKAAILQSVKKTGKVVVVEDHQVNGGLAGAVAELLAEEYLEAGGKKPWVMRRVGMRDRFGESGKPEELLSFYRMDKKAIEETIGEMVAKFGR